MQQGTHRANIVTWQDFIAAEAIEGGHGEDFTRQAYRFPHFFSVMLQRQDWQSLRSATAREPH